ncbi:MAG TPA: SigB/SigF/SigG family RNA polymerase sigma factor [Acidimicrobiia bacterium]
MTEREQEAIEDLFAVREQPEAKRELVEAFDGLAQRLARRFGGRGVPLDDLVQVARFGLLKAIERFDADRGIQFSTFAGRTIIGEIKHYFRDQAWSVRVPRTLQNLWLEVSRAVDELTHTLGRSPTIEEIAESLDVSEEEVLEALDAGAAYTASSLDRPLGEEGDATVVDQLGDLDPGYETAAVRGAMSAELRALPERERTVLYLRFFDGRTQAEIADEIGVSQVHVSRILSRTLDQLREAIDPEAEGDSGESDV